MLTRLGRGLRGQALAGHKMPGITAACSHGGPGWNRKLRDAVTRLKTAYPLVDTLVYKQAVPGVHRYIPNPRRDGNALCTRLNVPSSATISNSDTTEMQPITDRAAGD